MNLPSSATRMPVGRSVGIAPSLSLTDAGKELARLSTGAESDPCQLKPEAQEHHAVSTQRPSGHAGLTIHDITPHAAAPSPQSAERSATGHPVRLTTRGGCCPGARDPTSQIWADRVTGPRHAHAR